jgi:predicted Zn-dependent peptidase
MKRTLYILALFLLLTYGAAHPQTSPYRFDNGFTFSISESAESSLAGMSLLIYGGTQFETAQERGTYRLILDTLMRGTQYRTADDISLHISQLGDSVDTYITGDYWAIEATVASEDMRQLLELVYDLTRYPLFLDEELVKAKNIAVQTIRTQEDSPLHVGFDFYRAVFYPDFYASPEERIRNIEKMERNELLTLYRTFFTPGNMVLALSGNLDGEKMVRLVASTFGSDPRLQTAPKRESRKQQPDRLPGFKEKRGGITQAGIIIGTRLEDFDRRDTVLIEVVNAVLDNSLGGRLYEEVREKSGLVYSISPYFSIRIQPYTWFILATTRKRNYHRVIRETERVLQNLTEEPPSDEELYLAKSYVITRLAISYQSPIKRAHYEAERLMRGEQVLSLEERFEAIDGVEREEVLHFINRYIPGAWTTLVVR